MISVIIPFMKRAPYDRLINECIYSLEQQTGELEIILSTQKEERYIRKNFLYNKGIAQSSGEIIWFCDADFTLKDENFLKNMSEQLTDVLCPYFYSHVKGGLKVADGGPMMTREVIEKHGPLDESLIGISWVTFPFLRWCIENTDFKCNKEFIVTHNGSVDKKKRHSSTTSKMRPIYKEVSKYLESL